MLASSVRRRPNIDPTLVGTWNNGKQIGFENTWEVGNKPHEKNKIKHGWLYHCLLTW